ncbi:uncharacterized protein DSM5745_10634 [Aspergillus mulundensis]|uniref:Major facilitator superfamily (MFS) profile domain-containing protein n=1 Tax=Aspergillus mulundensis TaxID=1810919 RepID=A0A3D8QH15_9EURO|nr:hypothetical protein DSM5745_10634 [Aspergillus mulundensis]RDW61136.1 hypothetical protein DSM5745_10634 [Aspergillus mulundensis]
MVASEESPLLRPSDEEAGEEYTARKEPDTFVIYAAFLGVFIASADEMLVISTYSAIASQFHRLSEGSWLLLAYNFGYCISLPVVSGCQYKQEETDVSSSARSETSMAESGCLFGRWREHVHSAAGPVKSACWIQWRRDPGHGLGDYHRSFFGQVPAVIGCALFCFYRLPSYLNDTETKEEATERPAPPSGIRDLDFAGLFTFAGTILLMLFLLRALGAQTADMFFQTSLLAFFFLCGCILFVVIELFWAQKPLVPIRLFSQTIGIYFAFQALILGGRLAFNANTVPYFIRIHHASDSLASLGLVASMVGVGIGGVVCGLVIKRTKRSKPPILFALAINLIFHTLIFLSWRHQHDSTPQRHIRDGLYLLGTGLAPGILFPALFTAMAAVAPEGQLHACIGTYYLCQQLGLMIGPAAAAAVSQSTFERGLWRRLGGVEQKRVLINRILNEVRFAETLPANVQRVVRECYLAGFQYLPLFPVAATAIMLPVLLVLREPRLA